MDREQEKNAIYQALVDLATARKNPDLYFSEKRILNYFVGKLSEEGIVDVFRGKGYDTNSREEVDVTGRIPKISTFRDNLEALVKERRIEIVLAETTENAPNYRLYRAKKKGGQR